jgi:hypothetical protein
MISSRMASIRNIWGVKDVFLKALGVKGMQRQDTKKSRDASSWKLIHELCP